MLSNFLPLVDWGNGILQTGILLVVFLGLIIMLFVFMLGGKKKGK